MSPRIRTLHVIGGAQLYKYFSLTHTHAILCGRANDSHKSIRRELSRMTLLSMNQMTTYRWSLAQDVENYQEAGYSAIGVWRKSSSMKMKIRRSIG